ncbi:MAG: glycosyltransferase [Acidobacteria bacterium]|nr:glycosyltransferase [Acidobacteriota bacterium]
MPPPLIAVFAKAPRPGFVKTRLGLDPALAAALHEVFVRDTLMLAQAASPRVQLHTDVETEAWQDLTSIPRRLQVPGDLGERMYAVLALATPAAPVLIIGADAPSLPHAHLAQLISTPGDVVLGPADDGGYWAILARRADAAMFVGVEWSTARALDQTLAAAHAAGLSTGTGPSWYDVDEPRSLRKLMGRPLLQRPHTRDFLTRHPIEVHLS